MAPLLFARLIIEITAKSIAYNAHIVSGHFDFGFDVLQSKWTGPYRSPNRLARIILAVLKHIQTKGNYDQYYYHEYCEDTQTHLHRWRIEVPRRVCDPKDGPTGIFWQDDQVWRQWSLSIWIRPSGFQSIFPNGGGTNALFPNTVRKWRNTTTAQYHEIPEHLKQLISSGKNKTIIQIILQFISFPKTYYTNCILFHNICIPDLVAAHRENCKQLQRPTGQEREIALADVQDWAKFPEFQLSSQGTQGTNQSRYTKSSISG